WSVLMPTYICRAASDPIAQLGTDYLQFAHPRKFWMVCLQDNLLRPCSTQDRRHLSPQREHCRDPGLLRETASHEYRRIQPMRRVGALGARPHTHAEHYLYVR